MKFLKRIYLFIKKIGLDRQNIFLSKNVDFRHSKFEGFNRIGEKTIIYNSQIGKMSYIGVSCDFKNSIIGSFCSISNNVRIIYGRHPINTFFSTHPSFYSIQKQSGKSFVTSELFNEHSLVDNLYSAYIGNDVWIGDDVKILEGISIGDGAIIATGALVISDVAPYSIVAGVPAKVVKKRFDDESIEYLMKIKWWDNSLEWFESKDNIDKINNKINLGK